MTIAQYINHFNAVRLRVVGSGNLKLTLHSLDDIESQSLVNVAMSLTSSRQPTKLANFKTMKARLELRVSVIDEHFEINGIAIYSKPVETSFPE